MIVKKSKKNITEHILNETLTTSPRLERKAAAIAKNNMRKMVRTVQTKKTLFRHGWEQDDQYFSIDVAPSIGFSHNIQTPQVKLSHQLIPLNNL